jgi:ABC-2 type transport system permease protein
MKNVMVLWKRELHSQFVTPSAYAVISGFLLLSGFFFFSLIQFYNDAVHERAAVGGAPISVNERVIIPYYQTLIFVLIFLIPVITMRCFAEERSSGTFELISTSPVSNSQFVLGKYLGVLTVILIMLLLSLVFPISLFAIVPGEPVAALTGLLGVFLFAAACTAVGIAIAFFTNSQTVAGVISLVTLLLFYALDWPAQKFGEPFSSLFYYLAPSTHADRMINGVISGTDTVYFLSAVAVALFVAHRALGLIRWR